MIVFMLRDGSYAIYKGKEYEFLSGNENYRLKSYNSDDLANGFVYNQRGSLIKSITLDEIESVHSIYTWCKYKGYDFQVIMEYEEDDEYDIVFLSSTTMSAPPEDLGFEFVERGEYRKRIKRNEVSIYEVINPIPGYK